MREINELSLPEVFATLNKRMRGQLSKAIARETGRAPQTIWNWVNGYTIPNSILERRVVARLVNKGLGAHTSAETLFPEE